MIERFYCVGPEGSQMVEDPIGGYVRCSDYDKLVKRLSALQSAAWDVCDLVQDALDTPEDADMKAIQTALDAMGELIPAQRPTDY